MTMDDMDAQARLVAEVRDIWDAKAAFWDEHMGEGNAFQLELIGPAVELGFGLLRRSPLARPLRPAELRPAAEALH